MIKKYVTFGKFLENLGFLFVKVIENKKKGFIKYVNVKK